MRLKNFLIIKSFFLVNLFFGQICFADNHDISEILKLIQKDIKTLEKAVYSGSIEQNNNTLDSVDLDSNSEDVLTRHLLKLSEIENLLIENAIRSPALLIIGDVAARAQISEQIKEPQFLAAVS